MGAKETSLLFSCLALAMIVVVQGQRNIRCRRGETVSWTDPRGITHQYLFSWENRATRGQEVGGNEAQNMCRQYCMNLVSLETPGENHFIKQRLANAKQRYIWTSGRKCPGCSIVNGWFWSGSGVRIGATNTRRNGDWSQTGGVGRPQPDNREGPEGKEETCLAVLNNFYNDGINWHDVACHHLKPFVCESG